MELGKRNDAFLQGLIDEQNLSKTTSDQSKASTMIHHLLSLQESEPKYYTDEIIKGHILVSTIIQSLHQATWIKEQFCSVGIFTKTRNHAFSKTTLICPYLLQGLSFCRTFTLLYM